MTTHQSPTTTSPDPATGRGAATEREARELAEAAREQQWERPSFAKGLYLGHFDLDLIHPHPRGSAEDVQRGNAFLDVLREVCIAGRDPIGRRIHMEWGDTLVGTVVGIVGDIKHTGVDSVPEPTVYWALPQFPSNFMTLVVRTEDRPERLANALLAQVGALDPDQPVADLKPFDEWLGGAVARRRFTLLLLGGFAGLALVLTVIGLYGTTAYGVVQRTRELGIRSALGARRVDLLWSVLRQAVQVVAIGAAAGCVLALALSRVLSSLLFEVSATDPVVFIAITLLLLVVGATAGLLPARKATRVDPMIAIRAE